MSIFRNLCSFRAIPKITGIKSSRLGFIAWLLIAAVTVTGCSNDEAVSGDSGELVLGLTDAAGDFSHYTVDVKQITLTKLNGAVVDVLPASTQVDFAQYTEMTEFLTAAMVPAGIYKKATLSLDYSNADIWVEDNNGTSVHVDSIVGVDGNAITALDVSVVLEGRKRLAIIPGTPAHMTLDFDLNASNIVEFDVNDVPTVTVEPLLVADLDLERPKIHRVRGPLAKVDIDRQLLGVIIRPFHHTAVNDDRFGALAIKVNDATVYDINNEDYVGTAGLEAMDALPAFAATVVVGNLKLNPIRFLAREVYAGSSVPGGTLDVVKGTVVARVGDSLTVRGATLIRAGGSVVFNDRVTVDIASTTKVKKQLSVEPATSDDISVGQRVSIFGTLTSDVATALTMDATEGFVRMKITNLRGTSIAQVSIPEIQPPFVVNLQAINHLRPSVFDFTGTGINASNDADASNYEIATSGLNLSAIADNSPVLVKGFVHPFGQAPQDFDAISVTDFSEVAASMAISWNPSTDMPFTSHSDIDAVLNLTGTGKFHHFGQAGIAIDMNGLSTAPSVVAAADGSGHYIIMENDTHQIFDNMAAWIASMDARIASGSFVKGMRAVGRFDQASAELIVKDAIMVIDTSSLSNDPGAIDPAATSAN